MSQATRIFFALISLQMLIVPAASAEKIEFGVGEYRLQAELFRPAGAGPFPTVVAMHGCGGLLNSSGKVRAQYTDWGEKLAAQGMVVLFPDSYGSRGLGSQCRVRARSVQPSRERVADAHAARTWLLTQ